MGIQLKDDDGGIVLVATASSKDYTLQSGDNTLNFTASYISVPVPIDITAGFVNAVADFTLNYN
ncbi:TPA: type 1 fimbrial protein [Escherichia coli]|nr:type 1 fimbrial protein [Escherichia coli]